MSFRYQFILSFVLLEAFFIILIVTINFVAISDSSTKLNNEKINSNITFLDELVKVPLSIYDLATLDNIVENSQKLDYINSIVIVDAQDKILSQSYYYKHQKLQPFIKQKINELKEFTGETYQIRYEEVFEEDTYLGAIYLVFDLSENTNFIQKNKMNTLFIVMIEIILSTIVSYLIGTRLTQMLTNLSETAKVIGENKEVEIPYQDKKDEIGLLSNSMNQMQNDLIQRNQKLKDFAKELHKQKEELIEANKSKDDFLANMSHELKTPLNSINVISSVMMKNKKGKLDSEQVKNLQIINGCGNDLLYLINDVLDLSKLEAGEIELNYENIDFEQTMNSIKEMFLPQIKEKSLILEYAFDERVKNIYSDAQRIKQIVKNLLSNALKFTQKGVIRLRVKKSEESVQIIVQDEGIGISKEKIEHIFDRFKQADGSTTRQYGGTGLGLAICKELVSLLKGEISVKSKEGEGTTFTINIPMNLDKILIQSQVTTKVTLNNEILVLNNDILGLMPLIVRLKKEYTVNQTTSLIDFSKQLSHSYKAILVNITSENYHNVISLFKNNNTLPIIFFVDSAFINDSKLLSISSYLFKKPYDVSSIISLIKRF